MAPKDYSSESIQVLTGLDPVRKRPGMYTDTSRPNHLLQEVIDNSVDEALAGHARRIDVRVGDDALEVSDDGRGMPVDVHPEHGISGVELILTRLHAGGKFDGEQYRFSGGLHGVGVSVVNALSSELEVEVRRGGRRWVQRYANGEPQGTLDDAGPARGTGTRLRFVPDPAYFDSPRVQLGRLEHLLRAKAVLCPGLTITLTRPDGETTEWHFDGGLGDYLLSVAGDAPRLPQVPFTQSLSGTEEGADFAVLWLPEGGELVHRVLRQPDSHVPARHPRERPAHGAPRRDARILRAALAAAAGREADPGRRLGALQLRAVVQARGSAVLRPDQGAPQFPARPRRSSPAWPRTRSACG
jgi:topoisomerase-4 subunit B